MPAVLYIVNVVADAAALTIASGVTSFPCSARLSAMRSS